MNVSFEEYEQPFPTFLIELPEEYRRKLTEQFNYECPIITLTSPRSTIGNISFRYARPLAVRISERSHVMSPRPCFKTVEQALRFSIRRRGTI